MSLTLTCGVFLLIAVPTIIAAESVRASDWIGFAGNVLAAGMTIIAAAVAYSAVQRQVRIGLLGREEERIENALPGLREIAGRWKN